MVQLLSKRKEKKWWSDYTEQLTFKPDPAHVKSHSINEEVKLSTQQHKLQTCTHHSPLKHAEDYL